MPKKKQFLHPKKESGKRKPAGPETANEFLEAGVDHEEGGEKWRAGDAAKSLRFFVRAIDTYDAGLQRFPEAFDLAYNKARLQYEVTQQPRLLAHLPTPLNELLQVALDSHRFALTINQDNADVLFNTAQVLTSLAEVITEGKNASDGSRSQALKLLQQSLEISQRCLNVQEYQLNQAQELEAIADQDGQQQESAGLQDGGASRAPNAPTSDLDQVEEETWASILEPVTTSSLLDTVIAQIETLTTICTLESSTASPAWPLAWVEEYYQTSLQSKLSKFASTAQRQDEARLAEAKFRCALADAAFRSSRIDLPTYVREVQESFHYLDMSSDDAQSLCDRADAELTLNASIRQQQSSLPIEPSENDDNNNSSSSSETMESLSKTSWTHITTALDNLTTASKLPTAQKNLLARIHLRRGDCELLRLSLGEPPAAYALAIKSAPVLLGNAGLYYRMAGRMAASSNVAAGVGAGSGEEEEGKEEGKEAFVKGLIVSLLAADSSDDNGNGPEEHNLLGASREMTREDIRVMVGEMQEEGILGSSGAERVVGFIS